jgi:ankyrin repeat protein
LQLDDQLGFYDAIDTDGDRYHDTLLCAAARLGRPASVRLLLHAGACVDVVDEGGQTPLHLACAGETRSGFVRSCSAQDCLAMVTTLLDAGANVNARDECGCTPLHYLMIRVANDCHFAHSEAAYAAAKALCQAGADVNAVDDTCDEVPLYYVSVCVDEATDYSAYRRLLTDHGANAIDADVSECRVRQPEPVDEPLVVD